LIACCQKPELQEVEMDSQPEKDTLLSCTIELPAGFRHHDVLTFHQRDSQMVAERVEAEMLHKGLIWAGYPACLTIQFSNGCARASLAIDGTPAEDGDAALARMAHRMLGLTQRVEDFERDYGQHHQLGALIGRKIGLRVPLTPTPFEALTWAITGQQISVSAAVSIRRKLIQVVGLQHSSGLWCYPDARSITTMTEADLRQTGLSLTKVQTIKTLSELIEKNQLPLDQWVDEPPVEDIRTQLQQIKGIGPWTVNYALLRGFGWLDGSLHGDAAVRRNLQLLLGKSEKVTADEAQQWLAEFSPWRALVAAHLWSIRARSDY
jgi:DNA-3-methyladenine glycosylase II